MKKIALVFFVALAAVAAAFPQTETQPSMTVYGLELGKPFTVPECSLFKLGRKDYIYAENDNAVCYEVNPSQHRADPKPVLVSDGSVKLRFPVSQGVIGNPVNAGIVRGNLEAVSLTTSGVSNQDYFLDLLTKKYGKPLSVTDEPVQNMMGATFNGVFATWGFKNPGLVVMFKSVDGSLNYGWVKIATTTALTTAAAAKTPEGPKL